MRIRMVFFDLDGTLLPMDMDAFTSGYFRLLAKKAAPRGYELESMTKAIWHGTAAMVRNDGKCSNEEAFWQDFAKTFGPEALRDRALFEDFYANEFEGARSFCGYNPAAADIVAWLREQRLRVALATNPLFPAVATKARVRWAGLDVSDFEFYTTYENIGFCKPNLDYYRELLRRAALSPRECLMVGNDVQEDMVAMELGLQGFLLTDCLINRGGEDIARYPHGSFEELRAFVKNALSEEKQTVTEGS